jgi:transforming growth factor-beta-induced protein
MKIISKTLKLLTVFVLVLGLTGCSDDDDNNGGNQPNEQNIVEIALEDPQLTLLVDALQRTGLTGVLEQDGPFTVLAPTNAAFTAFLDGTPIEDVDVDDLAAILLNHVIAGDFEASDLAALVEGYVPGSSPNEQGLNISIYFNTTNGVRFNDAASVIDGGADIEASNGVIHKINAVLGLPDIADHAIANPNLTSLVTSLGAANLVDAVRGEGPLTVLAPDNDAFTAFLDEVGQPTVEQLTQVLLNHVLDGSITSSMLVNMGEGYTTTSAAGPNDLEDGETNMTLYFQAGETVQFNGISTVENADVVATNGVIHTVNAVIGLPTIATFATANPALSGLVAAILRADEGSNTINWLPAISNPDLLFTVFAPADPAFDVLLTDLGAGGLDEVDPAAVNDLLTLHVVNNANARSNNLGALNGTIPAIGGNLNLDGLVITDGDGNEINILAPNLVDIQAVNGVVHAVDYVIRAAAE